MKGKLIMEIPHYEHKYITLFNNEESYWNKETSFEEVNYSAIKTELTDNSKRNYQPSIRTTNKDNEYIMNYWKSDVMRGKFFLEIIWGYFGWEWKDYNKMIDSGTPAICTFQVFNREPAIYLALSANGVITSSEPYELTMEENEDGTFYLTDGTYYVGLAGNNNYDLSSDPTKKVKITIETTEDGQVYLKESKGYIGHNPATDTNKFYADKPKQSMYSFIKTKVGGIDPTYITYTGGNLYKVKEIETVRSIIDGYRLQHINDFLNSQDKVTTVEPFDVSNIIAMNRAFKRIKVHKNGGKIYWNARTPLTLKIYDFPNVVEADELFKGSILTEGTYNLPSVESIDQLYSFSVIDGNSQFKFQLDNLNELTDCFAYTRFKEPVVNLNRFFTGDALNKVKNLTGMCLNSTFRATDNVVDQEITVNLDLMQHEPLAEGEAIDMTRLFKDAGIDINNNNTLLGTLHINLNYKDSVIMDEAFYRILARYRDYTLTLENKETVIGYNKRGFKYLDINFTPEKINLITSLKETFRYNTFETKAPINFCPANCDDSSIYENCTFNNGVDYDFSPSHEVKKGIGQFRNTTINGEFNFQNVDALKTVDFSNMKFDTPKPFPYILDNPEYQYNEDGSRYRDICFANTGITEIPNQDIYIKYYRNGNQNTPMRLFQGCSYFKPTKDIHIYIEDRLLVNSGNHDSPFMLFEGCSEMVETPTVHWNHSYNYDGNVMFIFNGCVKLERINFLHVVRVDSYISHRPSMSLSADIVPSLIYLELGNYTGSIDLSRQKNLDIPTLTDTLMRQSRTKKFGTLYININIWNALSQETRDHCLSIYNTINIDEY